MLPDSLPLAGKIILLAPGVSGPYLAGPFANGVSDAGAPIQEGTCNGSTDAIIFREANDHWRQPC
jgi:hypothetical protein